MIIEIVYCFLQSTESAHAHIPVQSIKSSQWISQQLRLRLQSRSVCVTTIHNSVCLQKAIWLWCDLASNPVRYAPWACSLLSDILLLKNNTDAGPCLTLVAGHSWTLFSLPPPLVTPPPPHQTLPLSVSVALRRAVVWVTLLVLKYDMFPASWPVDEAVRACRQLVSVNHGSAAWVSPVGHPSAQGLRGICTVWSPWQCCLSPISSYISSLVIHTHQSDLRCHIFRHH